MSAYVSIKEEVLQKLETHLPEIRDRFGIETLSLFGSVARGEDTPASDIDLAYTRSSRGFGTIFLSVELAEYLKKLLGRSVDLVPLNWVKPRLLRYIEQDSIECGSSRVAAGDA
ncbi:MAG TPA: nucleotidyltransferase domain-containing protein [Methanocorpusculum sp.]|nr:nucleotidyltransferase domain-containing protein [Methanocorpusculum sp.]